MSRYSLTRLSPKLILVKRNALAAKWSVEGDIMDFISGVILVGIAFVLAVLFFFGIAVWLEIQPQKNRRSIRKHARSRRAYSLNNVRLTEV